jgi:hypothetical protein
MDQRTLKGIRITIAVLGIIALLLHVLENWSFLRMGKSPRFVIDGVSLGLLGVVVLGLLLPYVEEMSIGDTKLRLTQAVAQAAQKTLSATGVSELSELPPGEDSNPLGSVGAAKGILVDLTEAARMLASANGVPMASSKPAATLVAELSRRQIVKPELAEAYFAVLRPAQTAAVSGERSMTDLVILRKASYLLMEAFDGLVDQKDNHAQRI